MNIEKLIKNKMNRFVNNEEKTMAIEFLSSTIDEMIENENPSEEELINVIDNFASESNIKLKFFRRKYVQILTLILFALAIVTFFVILNPQWRFSDQSSYLIENDFSYVAPGYTKTTTKELTLSSHIIESNAIFSDKKPGDVVEITYEFNVNLLNYQTGPYNSCTYETYYNGQQLITSGGFTADYSYDIGYDVFWQNTKINSTNQSLLVENCNELVEFSAINEPITYK